MYLHVNGIVHGDLKPLNVIVQEQGHHVYLVDFGLAAVRPTGADGSIGYTEFFGPPERRATDLHLNENWDSRIAATGGVRLIIFWREVQTQHDCVAKDAADFVRLLDETARRFGLEVPETPTPDSK